MGARNRVGIGLSYQPASLHRLAESIPGLPKSKKIKPLVNVPFTCLFSCEGDLKVHKIEIFFGFFFEISNIFVSYVKILRFSKKKFWLGPVLEEVVFFRGVLRLRGMKKIFELGQKNIFFFIYEPFTVFEPILFFSKFDPLTAPGMALCVDPGPKCQNLFCLVWN